ncbi:MAG: hypothetical protein Ct9H90mP16_08210 [Candidatus Poseidoniales archaeon]|nr:MAG: hypothetical protein Ct9H90mP16_08210 [Candidatus Poseidoniales archaeon]
MGMDTRVIIGLTAIVIVLAIIVLITGRNRRPRPPCDLHQQVFHNGGSEFPSLIRLLRAWLQHCPTEAQGHDSLAATRAP